MGALGHYIEQEGIATAGLSLVRLHSEKIRPPRALWVPFELGRPLGAPNDPAFQTRVLRALLALLERPSGPVLEDFPDDAPGASAGETAAWSCPVSFDRPAREETLAMALRREIAQLQPWHDLARERRGRSTFGDAGLDVGAIADLLIGWHDGGAPPGPRPDLTPPQFLKLAIEDLKAFYFESAAAQPGSMTGRQAAGWFWTGTTAATLLVGLRTRCMDDPDPVLQHQGRNNMVPRDQWGRLGITERWWREG